MTALARKRNNRKWPNKEARKRATAKVKKQISKDGSEPAKQDSECTGQKSVSAKAVGKNFKSSQTVVAASVVANEEMITAEDVRRSASGRSAIAKAAKLFRKLESLKFEKPAFNSPTNMCELTGVEHVSWKAFEGKVGKFFECQYAFARGARPYGDQAFSDLLQIYKAFQSDPPSRTGWAKLIRNVAKLMETQSLA